jgi:hypothetical protein
MGQDRLHMTSRTKRKVQALSALGLTIIGLLAFLYVLGLIVL